MLELDWAKLVLDLDKEGYAVLPGLLTASQIGSFLASWDGRCGRSGAEVEATDFDARSTQRLMPPLPSPLNDLASELYGYLALISNRWMSAMGRAAQFPARLAEMQMMPSLDGHEIPQAIVSHLRAGEHEALHQTPVGEQGFLLEVSILLSQPGDDFTGGEFVMIEQRPRMQSRPIVVPLNRGDAVIFAAAQRPFKGSKGFYRVNTKHAISRVRSGQRLSTTIFFHGTPEVAEDD